MCKQEEQQAGAEGEAAEQEPIGLPPRTLESGPQAKAATSPIEPPGCPLVDIWGTLEEVREP